METFEAEFSDVYACYDCKKILKKGDEYKFKILCTDCFEEECMKDRGERLEENLFTANKIAKDTNEGRDFKAYEMVMPEEVNRGRVTNESRFMLITEELGELYARKNRDYGNAFGNTYKEFGLVSAVIRLNDKMNRLKKLTTTGSQEIKDESIRDTLVDLANYSIMTLMEMGRNE